MTNKTAMQQAWEIEERTNPHTAYNSWCRGYEAGRKDENEACWFAVRDAMKEKHKQLSTQGENND